MGQPSVQDLEKEKEKKKKRNCLLSDCANQICRDGKALDPAERMMRRSFFSNWTRNSWKKCDAHRAPQVHQEEGPEVFGGK